MSYDPFVAEVLMLGANFAPRGFAQCNGQLMPISQNTALFSLLGTYYGGDGKSTFALPNLMGRTPLGGGQGAGLSARTLGEMGGTDHVTLLASEMPAHTHTVQGKSGAFPPSNNNPTNGTWSSSNDLPYVPPGTTPATSMSGQALGVGGGSLPHNNLMPYLVINFVIALQGIYPPRP